MLKKPNWIVKFQQNVIEKVINPSLLKLFIIQKSDWDLLSYLMRALFSPVVLCSQDITEITVQDNLLAYVSYISPKEWVISDRTITQYLHNLAWSFRRPDNSIWVMNNPVQTMNSNSNWISIAPSILIISIRNEPRIIQIRLQTSTKLQLNWDISLIAI